MLNGVEYSPREIIFFLHNFQNFAIFHVRYDEHPNLKLKNDLAFYASKFYHESAQLLLNEHNQ